MKHPSIIAALERRRAGYTGAAPTGASPREFLLWSMSDPEALGMGARIKLAVFLMHRGC